MENTETKTLKLSVLLVREEYMNAMAAIKRKRRRQLPPVMPVMGYILSILGFAGLLFGRTVSLAPSVALVMILFGLFLIVYELVFQPILDRGAAAQEYNEKEDIRLSNIYVFSTQICGGRPETTVEIRNSRIEARLPLSAMTEWSKTSDIYSITFGRECRILIPKRLLNEENIHLLEDMLQSAKV